MEIKERIITGGMQLFFKHGIKSVTMDDIAKNLGISKKTLYQHFEDKDQVIREMLHYYLEDDRKKLEHFASSSKNSIDEIFHLMESFSNLLTKVNPNLFFDLQKYHPACWKIFLDFKENCMLEMIRKNLKNGIEQGLYRTDLQIEVIARLRLEEVSLAMNPDVFSPQKFNFAKTQIEIFKYFLHGITTLKGHKLLNKHFQLKEED